MNIVFLADSGTPRATIVIGSNPGRTLRFAAGELAKYLEKMSGASFRIEGGVPTSTPAPPFSIVLSNLSNSAGPDGFRLVTRDRELLIEGRNPRSVLYGVYALLERLGCRFVEPGVEFVPLVPRLAIETIDQTETAAFAIRNIFRNIRVTKRHEPFHFLDPEIHLAQIDWMAKRRLNHYEFYVDYYRYDLWEKHKAKILDALLDRGFDIEQTYHSIHYFCPPDENHDFGNFGPATYVKNHSDWYIPAMERGDRGMWQTRVELPAVREIITERYLEYFRRNRELKILGLWPDDVPMNNPSIDLNPADGYVQFWNQVAAELKREMPDKQMGIIAYFELIRPPRREVPLENEHCWFCPLERNFQYAIDHERNRQWLEPLKGWVDRMPPNRVSLFEYYGWSVPFIPFRRIMQRDLQTYRTLKVGGVYGWAGFTSNILGEDFRWALDLYALANLLWDPESDLQSIEETWTSAVFDCAAAEVLEFFDTLGAAHEREAAKGIDGYFMFEGDNRWIGLEVLRSSQQILQAARARKPSSMGLRRIDLLEQTLARGATAVR